MRFQSKSLCKVSKFHTTYSMFDLSSWMWFFTSNLKLLIVASASNSQLMWFYRVWMRFQTWAKPILVNALFYFSFYIFLNDSVIFKFFLCYLFLLLCHCYSLIIVMTKLVRPKIKKICYSKGLKIQYIYRN